MEWVDHDLDPISRIRSYLLISIRSLDLDLLYTSWVWVTLRCQREYTWCKPHRYKGEISWEETRGFESRDTDRPCDVLVFLFDWLTFNRVQFTSVYTRRVATSPGRNSFCPLGIGVCHASLITKSLDPLAFRLRAT